MNVTLKCHGRVKGFCIFENCQNPRIFCLKCMKDHNHNMHDDAEPFFVEIEDLEKWLSDKFQISQQLVEELVKLCINIQKSFTTFKKYINQFDFNHNNSDVTQLSLTQLNNIINHDIILSKYSTYIQDLILPFSLEFERILNLQTQNKKNDEIDLKQKIQEFLKIGFFLLYNQGDILRGHEYYKEATKIYEVASQLNKKEYLALWNIADCLKKQRQFDEAILYYKQALDCTSQNKEGSFLGIGFRKLYNQGCAYLRVINWTMLKFI
ncbi:unnamed protein product [Paramecium sonneborni]|uniref:Tetratricopeptide repeat protein n=1 Tax=Paramecium sonneborni TaxID=65129 RepID=A0A8S1MZY8_9CILI|nr:unnamed protein product [Paramecium sonneborni]